MDPELKTKIDNAIISSLRDKLICKFKNKSCLKWLCEGLNLTEDQTKKVLSGEWVIEEDYLTIADLRTNESTEPNVMDILIFKWSYPCFFRPKHRNGVALHKHNQVEETVDKRNASYTFNSINGKIEITLQGIQFDFEIELYENGEYEQDTEC